MDTIRLRTLSWKSFLGFGKYKELSVQQIYDLGHTAYLRYIYYNMEGISFNEEILKAIHVINSKFDNRISKPGIDVELGIKIDHLMFDLRCKKMNPAHVINKNNKDVKLAIHRRLNYEKDHFSKAAMQRRNHNKY